MPTIHNISTCCSNSCIGRYALRYKRYFHSNSMLWCVHTTTHSKKFFFSYENSISYRETKWKKNCKPLYVLAEKYLCLHLVLHSENHEIFSVSRDFFFTHFILYPTCSSCSALLIYC